MWLGVFGCWVGGEVEFRGGFLELFWGLMVMLVFGVGEGRGENGLVVFEFFFKYCYGLVFFVVLFFLF